MTKDSPGSVFSSSDQLHFRSLSFCNNQLTVALILAFSFPTPSEARFSHQKCQQIPSNSSSRSGLLIAHARRSRHFHFHACPAIICADRRNEACNELATDVNYCENNTSERISLGKILRPNHVRYEKLHSAAKI